MERNPSKITNCPSCGAFMETVKPAALEHAPTFRCRCCDLTILGASLPKSTRTS